MTEGVKYSEFDRMASAWCDDSLTADEFAAMERQIAADDALLDRFLHVTAIHSGLSWEFAERPDFQSSACDDIDRVRPVGATNRRIRRQLIAAAITLLLVVISIGGYALFGPHSSPPIAEAISDEPVVVRVEGDVSIETEHGAVEPSVGRKVHLGESLLAAGDDDEVVLRYEDGTEITLSGRGILLLPQSAQNGKRLDLQSGMLQADVAPQPADRPLIIATLHTSVRVLGTRFELATDEHDGTRLDLESGRIELLRKGEKPLVVQPNSIAIVPPTAEPICISPRPAVDTTPSREAAVPGLQSVGYGQDERTIVASTRTKAVYWFADDRLEVLPVVPSESNGIWFKQRSGQLLAFEVVEPRSLTVWDQSKRQELLKFDDIRRLPRKDNASKDWTPPINVPAMSPHGDWAVFQTGRLFRVWHGEKNRWPTFPKRYDGEPATAMAASPDGELLAVALRRHVIDVMDVVSGEIVVSWSIDGLVPSALEFSDNGQKLAASFHGRVKVYDIGNGIDQTVFDEPSVSFLKVAISADGRYLATATKSHRVWRWDSNEQYDFPQLRFDSSVRDLAFSSDGRELAVATKGQLTVWNTAEVTQNDADAVNNIKSNTKREGADVDD